MSNQFNWKSVGRKAARKEFAEKVRKLRNGESLINDKPKVLKTAQSNIELQKQLQDCLSATVIIKDNDIVIHCNNEEELKRITEIIQKKVL